MTELLKFKRCGAEKTPSITGITSLFICFIVFNSDNLLLGWTLTIPDVFTELICFQGFSPSVSSNPKLSGSLTIQAKPVDVSVLQAGAQEKQLVNVECADDFSGNLHTFIIYFSMKI